MRASSNRKVPTVLIADNDEDERRLLKAVLKLKGFKVVEAAHGQEAIDLATCSTPDLLLIDLRLPRVSGPVVIRQITNQAHLRNMAMVAVSISADNARRSMRGLAIHLEKPVELYQLDSLIDRLFPMLIRHHQPIELKMRKEWNRESASH